MNPDPLKSWWKNNLASLLLLCVLALALFGRLQFIINYAPYTLHVDEPILSHSAVGILKTGDLNPHVYNYPSLPIYVTTLGYGAGYLIALASSEIKDVSQIGANWRHSYPQPIIGISGRILFAVISVATVWLIGLIAVKAFQFAPLKVISPLILLGSGLYLYHSRVYLNVDIIGDFFVVLSLYFLFSTKEKTGLLHKAVIPGVLTGCAIGCKYQLGLIIVPFLISIYLYQPGKKLQSVLLLMVFTGLGFILAVPYFIPDFTNYLKGILIEIGHYRKGHMGFMGEPGIPQFIFHNKELLNDYGLFLYILGLIGIVYAFKKNWRSALLLVSFPFLLLFYMSLQKVNFVRNLLPVYTLFSIFISLGFVFTFRLLSHLIKKLPGINKETLRSKYLASAVIILLLIIFFPLKKVGAHLQVGYDSRNEAVRWIKANIPKNSRIHIAGELRMDLKGLTNEYRLSVTPFKEIGSWAEALSKNPQLFDAYFLVPQFGYDSRWPERKKIAETLNARLKGLVTLKRFGDEKVRVGYFVPVPSGDPEFTMRALWKDQYDIHTTYQAAMQMQFAGRKEDSIPFLTAILGKNPDYQRTGFLLGFAHQKAGRAAEAIKTYQAYLEKKPRDIQARFNRAYALMHQGRFQDAIEGFNKTLELKPNYVEVHLHLSTCYKNLGNSEEAQRHLALWEIQKK